MIFFTRRLVYKTKSHDFFLFFKLLFMLMSKDVALHIGSKIQLCPNIQCILSIAEIVKNNRESFVDSLMELSALAQQRAQM